MEEALHLKIFFGDLSQCTPVICNKCKTNHSSGKISFLLLLIAPIPKNALPNSITDVNSVSVKSVDFENYLIS